MKINFKTMFVNLFKKSQNPNQNAKKEQFKVACVLGIIIIIAIAFYYYETGTSLETRPKNSHFAGVFDDDVGLSYDHSKMQSFLDKLSQANAEIQSLKKHQNAQTSSNSEHQDSLTLKQLEASQKEIQLLKHQMENLALEVRDAKSFDKSGSSNNASSKDKTKTALNHKTLQGNHPGSKAPTVVNTVGIDDVNILYPEQKKKMQARSSKNYLWAGTFAQGYLLSGVVADAGVNSTKNKGTVLIRLTSNGIMPNDKHSHLKGCFVLGSTYGDLSADTVVVHLETLSCSSKKYSFEKKVYGAVFDVDAMQDLRGVPVLKSGSMLTYASVAGFLSGIGDGISQSGTTTSVTGSGLVQTPSSVLRSGIGGGISKPSDKIADYIMDIANLIHPTVVARAGRRVTILFQAGFWLDQNHQKFESMKSVSTNTSIKNQTSNALMNESNHQIQKGQNYITPELGSQVAQASGSVQMAAEQKAKSEFNHKKSQLGQSLFSNVSNGAT